MFDVQHLSFDVCHSTFVIWHLSFDVCQSTFVIWRLSFDVCHLTFVIHSWEWALKPSSNSWYRRWYRRWRRTGIYCCKTKGRYGHYRLVGMSLFSLLWSSFFHHHLYRGLGILWTALFILVFLRFWTAVFLLLVAAVTYLSKSSCSFDNKYLFFFIGVGSEF